MGAYEWLVIAGAKAQYKGTGTIHGAGSFKLFLSALDAAVSDADAHDSDVIRVRIWEGIDGAEVVVYDNALGAEDASPLTELGGGQIVLLSGKDKS